MSLRDRNADRIPRQRQVSRLGLLPWLAGADADTLSHTPRERRKFIGLGGIVLTTAVFAAVSAAYALALGARTPLWAAIPAGALWGLAVMNLDRWLVTASQRRSHWYQNLLQALPRILMALIVGAVISTPMVLWLFQREIDVQLDVIQQRRLDQHQQALADDARFNAMPALRTRIAQQQAVANGTAAVSDDPAVKDLQAKYDDLDRKWQAAQASATCEFDGTCGAMVRGDTAAYRQKRAVADDLRAARDDAAAKLSKAQQDFMARTPASPERMAAAAQVAQDQTELDRLETLLRAEQDRFRADTTNDRGLLARLDALSELTDKSSTLRSAYLALLLFITTIEILPVMVRFLMNLAPATTYDKILERAEETDVAVATSQLERERDRVRFEAQARQAREEELIRQRIERATALDDLDHQPSSTTARRPTRTRLTDWLRRRDQPEKQHGYTPWPDEEPPTHRASAGRSLDEDDRLTERWHFDR